jgi:hypothetical protein
VTSLAAQAEHVVEPAEAAMVLPEHGVQVVPPVVENVPAGQVIKRPFWMTVPAV